MTIFQPQQTWSPRFRKRLEGTQVDPFVATGQVLDLQKQVRRNQQLQWAWQ